MTTASTPTAVAVVVHRSHIAGVYEYPVRRRGPGGSYIVLNIGDDSA